MKKLVYIFFLLSVIFVAFQNSKYSTPSSYELGKLYTKSSYDSTIYFFKKYIDEVDSYILRRLTASAWLSEIYMVKGDSTKASYWLNRTENFISDNVEVDSSLMAIFLNQKSRFVNKYISSLKARRILIRAESAAGDAPGILARVYVASTEILTKLGEDQEANKYIEKILSLYEQQKISDSTFYYQALLNRGLLHLYSNNLSEAYNDFKVVLDNHQSPKGNAYLKMMASFHLFAWAYYMEDPIQQSKFASISAKAGEQLFSEDFPFLANIYKRVTMGFLNTGDYEQAIDYAKKAIGVNKKFDNSIEIAANTINLGNCYLNIKDYNKAINAYKTIIPIFERAGASEVDRLLTTHNQLGNAYMAIEKFDSAQHHHQKSLNLKLETYGRAHVYTAYSYFNLGQIQIKLGNYSQAESLFQTCSDISKEINNSPYIFRSNTDYQLGLTFLKRNSYNKAISYFQKSIKALVPSFEERNQNALPDLDQRIISELQLLYPLAGRAEALHGLYKETGEEEYAESAAATFDHTFLLIDQLRNSFAGEVSKQELIEVAREIYDSAVQQRLEWFQNTKNNTCLQDAFRLVEQSKSVLLNEGVKESEAKIEAAIPATELEREQELLTAIAEIEKALFEEQDKLETEQDAAKITDLENQRFDLKRNYESFVNDLERNYPKYYQLKYQLDVVTVDQLRQQYLNVNPNTLLLQYFLGDSTLLLLGATRDTLLASYEVVDTSVFDHIGQLRSMLNDYQGPMSMNDEEQLLTFQNFTTSSHFLYQKLLEPILSQAKGIETLLIIPDGMLGYVPFETLITTPYEGSGINYRELDYLIRAYNTHYEYSATLLLQSAGKNNNFTKGLVGYAPSYQPSDSLEQSKYSDVIFANIFPGLRDGITPLKYNQPEVKSIGYQTGGEQYTGANATESNFKQQAEQYQVLHLAMHAFVNDVEPQYSHLVFQSQEDTLDDRFLHAYELYNMRLNAELAVLSACETGVGKLRTGEGIMSLSRAFKYAGCPNIVTSLWKADDERTKEVMTNFYANLEDGMGKGEALRLAKLSTLKQATNQVYAHPFYWATFVLIGNNDPIAIQSSGTPWYIWSIGLLLLAGLSIFFLRRRGLV